YGPAEHHRGQLARLSQAARQCSAAAAKTAAALALLMPEIGRGTRLGCRFERSAVTTAHELEPPLQHCADDGLDRPALPVLPSSADAQRAALHRDGDDRCGAAWRPQQASRL